LDVGGTPVLRWIQDCPLQLPVEEIGEHYDRYRLHLPEAERAMARSLERYGQLSPVVVCPRQDRYELIDGFKRLGAARTLPGMSHLSGRLLEADERTAKAAIYGLNRAGGRTRELEEAWIIQALVREDGLSQVEVAELLGRHKSWVCRRLALIERLGAEAREELRVGLLSPTAARQMVRLPEGRRLISFTRSSLLETRNARPPWSRMSTSTNGEIICPMARLPWLSSIAWWKEPSSSRSKASLIERTDPKMAGSPPEKTRAVSHPTVLATESPQCNYPAGPLSTAKMDPFFTATDTSNALTSGQ
jgi:hypothetical protein